MKFVSRRFILALPAVLALASGAALAQNYPSKPVTLVVPYPPGGDTDAIARLLGEQLASRLGQPVLVDNRSGAGGTLGASYVTRAAKDGYTLLFTPNFLSIAPFVMKLGPSNSYDPLQSFEPVIKSAEQPLLLVAHPSTGFKTVDDMVKAAKSGKEVNYGSPGAGTPMQVIAEMLNRAADTKIRHIPYRGVGPVVTDIVAGHVQTAWVTIGAVSQYIEQGKLVPLAIGDTKRSPLAPNIPTLVESGYKDVVLTAWNGIFAPKGVPAPVVQLLNTQVNEILKNPDLVKKFATFGALPAGGAPSVLGKVNETDYNVLGKVIRELNISAE